VDREPAERRSDGPTAKADPIANAVDDHYDRRVIDTISPPSSSGHEGQMATCICEWSNVPTFHCFGMRPQKRIANPWCAPKRRHPNADGATFWSLDRLFMQRMPAHER
jgi:hypothetical protein